MPIKEALRASDLIRLLQSEIDQHGDGYAQVNAMGNWLPIVSVTSWHGRTIIKHEPFHTMPAR